MIESSMCVFSYIFKKDNFTLDLWYVRVRIKGKNVIFRGK